MTRITLVLLVLTFCAAPAPAQHSSMSMSLYNGEDSFRPDLSARDLKLIVRVLGLGAAEEQSLQTLYAGYAGTLQNEGAEVRDFVNGEVERAEMMQNVGLLDKAHKRIAEWTARSEKIKKQFLDDLKSLLTREQEGRWPIVERELRRLRQIGDGRLAGESIDLVRLTEDAIGASLPPDVAELLNRYCEELDAALRARESYTSENQKEYTETLSSNPQRARQVWEGAQKSRIAVRDINDRFARQITAALPDHKRAQFERALFDQSFKALTHPTKSELYLKETMDLRNLPPEQQSRLDEIRNGYESNRRALLTRGAAAWRQFEADYKPSDLAEALGERPKDKEQNLYNGAWLPESHPLVAYRKERFELDRAMKAQLEAALTPEQKSLVASKIPPYAEFLNWSPWGL